MNNTINIYFHLATIGEYQLIYEELINKVIESDLISKINTLFVCIVGDGNLNPIHHDKIKTIKVGNVQDFEFPTLEKIENDISLINDNIKILYFNGLGVTGNTPNKKNWRSYLTYFNIVKFDECIKSLDNGYDVCGVDWRTDPVPHFSGNFWWANSTYLKTLPKINTLNKEDSPIVLTLRHNAEMYIGMNKNVKPRILWQSNVSQYERHLHMYEESNYIGKINDDNIIIH